MNTVNLFEVAGSVAGIAGISLVVFYFLFTSIIERVLPSLTRNAKKNIIVLMMFMVWSVTIIGMTTWIYMNTNNDGGQQPDLDDVEVAVEQEARNIIEAPKAVLSSASTYVKGSTGRLLVRYNDEMEETVTEAKNPITCGLRMKSNLWMSFNKSKPYYRLYYDGDVKVVLQDLDKMAHKASFRLVLNDGDKSNVNQFELEKGDAFEFEFKGCLYEFVYSGHTTEQMGLGYWFKTRYIAHYQIQPKL